MQDQQQMLVRWANRLTSNNLILMARLNEMQSQINDLQSQIDSLTTQLAEHIANANNQGVGNG